MNSTVSIVGPRLIDAVITMGHAFNVKGSAKYIDEVTEAEKVVKRVTDILNLNGLLALDGYDDISKTKAKNLTALVDFHNSKTRKLDVSIHFNALSTTNDPVGCEVLYKDNLSGAATMSKAISISGGFINRGAKRRSELTWLRGCNKNPLILEICFVDSKADTDRYHEKFESICQGIAYTIAMLCDKKMTNAQWKGFPLPEALLELEVSSNHKSDAASGSESGSEEGSANSNNGEDVAGTETEVASDLIGTTGDNSSGGFRVTTEGNTTYIIDKQPLEETLAAPIYPDLIEPRVSDSQYREIHETLKKELDVPDGQTIAVTYSDMVKMGIDVAKLFFTHDDYQDRSTTYNIKDHKYASKIPTFTKPANNNDPYPVDEKIEELESHLPFMKIHRLAFQNPDLHTLQMAKVVMDLSDKMEKRVIQLENQLATNSRYLFRLGARVNINCVYYGGQSEYHKYQAIRCMHDDRVNDGQVMTLDQCLACTRFEPILGKTYEIQNELGQSVDIINDDNQMSYQTMDDSINNHAIEEKPKAKQRAFIDIKTLEERTDGDLMFKEIWDEGFVMDWDFVPAEMQMPSVNYDDGKTSVRLDSSYKNIEHHNDPTGAGFEGIGIFYGPETSSLYETLGYGGGYSPSLGGGASGGVGSGYYSMLEAFEDTKAQIEANEVAFNSVTDPEMLSYIQDGKNYAKNVDTALSRMAADGYEQIILDLSKANNMDPLYVLSIIVVESTGDYKDMTGSYWGLMQVDKNALPSNYASLPKDQMIRVNIEKGILMLKGKFEYCWNTKNIVLGSCAYNSGQGYVVGNSTKKPVYDPGLNQSEHNKWLYTDIYPNFRRNVLSGNYNAKEKLGYYPRVHYVYKSLLTKKGSITSAVTATEGDLAKLNGMKFSFPYSTTVMKNTPIYLTSSYGYRMMDGAQEFHAGIDLVSKKGTPILAAADGTVVDIWKNNSTAGNAVIIEHINGVRTYYFHLDSITTSKNQQVKAGTQIGTEGTTGRSTNNHLHFEISASANRKTHVDPTEVFTYLKGQQSGSKPIKFNI